MKKNDIILIVSILIIAAALYLIITNLHHDGTYVVVRIDGHDTAEYPLDKDITIRLPHEDNKSDYNVLQIKDHHASIIEADCPDKICVRHRSISKNDESIICLPHKLSIHIKDSADINGSQNDSGVDQATY